MTIDRSTRVEKQLNYSELERNRSLLNQEDLYPAILKLPTHLLRESSPECSPFKLLQNQFQKVFYLFFAF